MKPRRDEGGKFPAYAWPGGYPIYYICDDGGVLCPACANGDNGSEASVSSDVSRDWLMVAMDVHWEGAPLICDHCAAVIESAYGDPSACDSCGVELSADPPHAGEHNNLCHQCNVSERGRA